LRQKKSRARGGRKVEKKSFGSRRKKTKEEKDDGCWAITCSDSHSGRRGQSRLKVGAILTADWQ